MKTVFKSVTDERLVLDILAPGFDSNSVEVKTAKTNGGEAFKIIVQGKYAGRKNKDGAPIPRVAYEKYVEDFKYVFSDDTTYGEELFRSKTFTSKDYDLDKLCFDVTNGVVRISVPKTDLARGSVVKASTNADAASSGVAKSDTVAGTDAASDED